MCYRAECSRDVAKPIEIFHVLNWAIPKWNTVFMKVLCVLKRRQKLSQLTGNFDSEKFLSEIRQKFCLSEILQFRLWEILVLND